MVHQRVAAVLGRRDDRGVAAGVDRQGVGALDPVLAEPVDRHRHEAGVGRAVLAQRARVVRRGLPDAHDVGGGPAVQHRSVLQLGGDLRGPRQVVELGVTAAALDVVDLVPGDGERHAVLRERQHATATEDHSRGVEAGRRSRERVGPPQRHRVVTPAAGADPVDQPASRQQRRQPFLGLGVDRLPRPVGNGGVVAEEVVGRRHARCPLRLPMPSEPSVRRSWEPSSLGCSSDSISSTYCSGSLSSVSTPSVVGWRSRYDSSS